jgi:hypothetical protein
VRNSPAISKRGAQKTEMGRFNLKKLNNGDVKEQYQIIIRNKFAALENSEDNGDNKRPWDNTRENVKILAKDSLRYCDSKHQKQSLHEKYSKLVDRGK